LRSSPERWSASKNPKRIKPDLDRLVASMRASTPLRREFTMTAKRQEQDRCALLMTPKKGEIVDALPVTNGPRSGEDSMKTVNRTIIALLSGIVSLAFVSTSLAAADPSIVVTERGPVRGTVTDGLRQFLGIPYAAPPLRNLRWRPPQEHASWSAPLNTTRFAPHCPQQASVFGTESV